MIHWFYVHGLTGEVVSGDSCPLCGWMKEPAPPPPLQHTHIQTPGERPGLPGFIWVLSSRAGFPNTVGRDQLRCQWKYGFTHCVFAVGVFGVGQHLVFFYQALQVLLRRLASGNLDQMGSREGLTACLREGFSSLHAFPPPPFLQCSNLSGLETVFSKSRTCLKGSRKQKENLNGDTVCFSGTSTCPPG